MTTISKDKQYRTRDGRETRVLMTDGGGYFPIIAAYKDGNDIWWPNSFTARGTVYADGRQDHRDLIEVKPRFRIERWVNVFRDCDGREWISDYSTRDIAVSQRGRSYLATKRIIIEGTEGEDDEEGK